MKRGSALCSAENSFSLTWKNSGLYELGSNRSESKRSCEFCSLLDISMDFDWPISGNRQISSYHAKSVVNT